MDNKLETNDEGSYVFLDLMNKPVDPNSIRMPQGDPTEFFNGVYGFAETLRKHARTE